MKEIHGIATDVVGASPDAVFRVITDLDRLPDWNRAIECVVEPATGREPGTEWIVKMHPSRGMQWLSRSRIDEIDDSLRRFRYRTWNADGNPSYSDWTWEVAEADGAATVTVTWDISLETLDRRVLAGPIRQRQLRKEVAASLMALDRAVREASISGEDH
jgi:hypothetical protein